MIQLILISQKRNAVKYLDSFYCSTYLNIIIRPNEMTAQECCKPDSLTLAVSDRG